MPLSALLPMPPPRPARPCCPPSAPPARVLAAAFAAAAALTAAPAAAAPTNRWVRAAGADARASVAANWSLGHAPKKNEVALFTARHPASAIWDEAAPREIGGLVLDEGYLAVLTLETTAGKPLRVAGDVRILGGALTHPQNDGDARWALRLAVGGDFFVASNALVSVSGKGYAPGKGPAPGRKAGWGGSHGGQGAPKALDEDARPQPTAGRILEPAECGSGGTLTEGADPTLGHGGGALRADVAGDIVVEGAVRADGDGRNPGNVLCGGAAGGSIDLRAGGTIRLGPAPAVVSADGGPAFRDGGGGGGGGRIALRWGAETCELSSLRTDGDSIWRRLHAYGGTGDTRNRDSTTADTHVRGAPGTVYAERVAPGAPAGTGVAAVRGNHAPGLATTRLPADAGGNADELQDAELVLFWGAFATLSGPCTTRAVSFRSPSAGFDLNRSLLTASSVSRSEGGHTLDKPGSYRTSGEEALVPVIFNGGSVSIRPYFSPAP